MAKQDLVANLTALREELKKVDDEHTTKRNAIIAKMRELQTEVASIFEGIEELAPATTTKKKASGTAPIDRNKVKAWFKTTLANGALDESVVREKYKASGNGVKFKVKDYADTIKLADGKISLVKSPSV